MTHHARPRHDAFDGPHKIALAAKLSTLTKPSAVLFNTPSLLFAPSSRPLVMRSQRWNARISGSHWASALSAERNWGSPSCPTPARTPRSCGRLGFIRRVVDLLELLEQPPRVTQLGILGERVREAGELW